MTTLPRIPTALRLNALLAAAVVTLVTLGAIDHLATSDGASAVLARVDAAGAA